MVSPSSPESSIKKESERNKDSLDNSTIPNCIPTRHPTPPRIDFLFRLLPLDPGSSGITWLEGLSYFLRGRGGAVAYWSGEGE
jgi:hypothetical protein